MFTNEFEGFSEKDKQTFKIVCNKLLAETFILRNDYKNGDFQHRNPDYQFLTQYEGLVSEYLSYANWNLYKEDTCGYYYVENSEGTNRCDFTAEQTMILLALRIVYEDNLQKAGLTMAVVTNVEEVLRQLIDVSNFYAKKPNMTDFKRNMKIFDGFNIIKAINGNYGETNCDFVILPTIQTAVPADRIAAVVAEIKLLEESTNEKTEESSTD